LPFLRKYDVSFSLGDSLRPGCLHDASDAAQLAELKTLGQLTRRAWEQDVQVMVEGPGHVPMDQIEFNVKKQMEECSEAPFYVLGPLVTDIAPGYDHITSGDRGGHGGLVWYSDALLCHAEGTLGFTQRGGCAERVDRLQNCCPCGGYCAETSGARDRDDELSRARYNFDWNPPI
jgi:phosphomethylpyrimidine synthase